MSNELLAVRSFQAPNTRPTMAPPRTLSATVTPSGLYTVRVSSPMVADAPVVLYQGKTRRRARKAFVAQSNEFTEKGYARTDGKK